MRTPPDMSLWTGRDDTATEGPDATRIHQCIKPWTEDSPPGVCLLGFACDEGVRRNQGRVGAAEGPTALRKALANLAWDGKRPLLDAGNVPCIDGDLASAQWQLGESITELMKQGKRPLILGGGHETAWGSFLGLVGSHPNATIGIIYIDAHFDLRSGETPHSGTPFRQMADWHRENGRPFKCMCLGISEASNTRALFKTAESLGVVWRTDRQLAEMHRGKLMSELINFIASVDHVYLSVDLDALPGSVMPAVSAPAGTGAPFDAIEPLIAQAASCGSLSICDVVEFNPRFDRDGLSARTAARLVWRIAHQWPAAREVQS